MKLTRIFGFLFSLVLWAEGNQAWAADTNGAPSVGSLREFDRFTFEGANAFTARNLWMALNSTYDFPELSHPHAPLSGFLTAIQSQLNLGYRHCGFPDAQITAQYDTLADKGIRIGNLV
jgi:hypothetical protein